MKKIERILFVFIIFICLIYPIKVSAQISPVLPDTVSGKLTSHSITKDNSGNYYLTFSATYNGYSHIFVRKSDNLVTWQNWNGSTFGTDGIDIPIESLGNYAQNKPIVTTNNNDVYIVWYGTDATSTTKNQIKISKYDGLNWSEATNLTSGNFEQSSPYIWFSNDNIGHLVWHGNNIISSNYTQIQYSSFDGSSWSSPINITSGNYYQSCPVITSDSNNNLYVAWYGTDATTSTYNQIRTCRFDGNTWSIPENITSGNYHQYNPSIITDKNDKVYIAWYGLHTLSTSNTQIRYSIYNENAWSAPSDISAGNYTQSTVSIGVDEENNICSIWHGKSATSSINQIRYSTYSNNTWNTPINITSGTFSQSYASIASNDLTIVWQGTTDSSGVSNSTNGIMSTPLIVQKSSNIVGTDILDNGDGRDIQINFNGSSDESNISEYHIALVKSKDSGIFTVDDALSLDENKYMIVAKTGEGNAHLANLIQPFEDSEGKEISNGEPYYIYVLSVAQSGFIDSISRSSNCITLTSAVSGGQKNSITNSDASLGQMIKDSANNYYATYITTYNGYEHVFVRKSDDGGQKWQYWNGTSFSLSGAELPIEFIEDYNQSKPRLAFDSLNNIHLVWSGGDSLSPGYTQIKYKKYDGNSWSNEIILGNDNYNQSNPSICIDSNDNVFVIWDGKSVSSTTYSQIRFVKFDGDSWGSVSNITSGDYNQNTPDTYIDSNNKIHIAWYGTSLSSVTKNQIRYSNFDGNVWSEPTNVTSGIYDKYNPSISGDSSNNIYLSWNGTNPLSTTYSQIQFSKYDVDSWSEPVNITTDNYNQTNSSISIDDANLIYVVWHGKDTISTAYDQIRFRKFDGTIWDVITSLTTGNHDQSNPISIKNEFTVLWNGKTDSDGLSSDSQGIMFYFSNPISSPSISPMGGSYNSVQNVTLTIAGNAISTYYTLDGSDPDDTDSLYVDGPIVIAGANGESITLKAVSYDNQEHVSVIATAVYNFDMVNPSDPICNINTGTYNTSQNIILTLDPDVSNTYYTLDGSNPDNTKTRYAGFITVDDIDGNTLTLKVISYDAAGNTSNIITQNYTFDKLGPNTPTFSILGGTFNSAQSVTITPAGDAISTYYTLDGSNPNNTKTPIDGAININGINGATVTLKAVSYDSFGNIGTVNTQNYIFDTVGPNAPTSNVSSGSYNTAKSIIITSSGDATSTYYTMDGSNPNNTKTLYASPFIIDSDIETPIVLKIVSYDLVGNIGSISTYTYIFDKTPPLSPSLNISGGTYNAGLSILLTPAVDTINTYYTLDGSNPDSTKLRYSGAISINGLDGVTITIKAISYDSANNTSLILTENYLFDKTGPAMPSFNILGGTYNSAKDITITPAVDAVTTYYTLDGSNPDNTKTVLGGSINVNGNDGDVIIIKSISYDAVNNIGTIASQTYTFDKVGPEAPSVDILTGTYNSSQNITIALSIGASSTYYTLDGTNPDNSKTLYVGTINVDGNDGEVSTLKAVCYDVAGNIGSMLTQSYTFDKVGPVSPSVDVLGGTYNVDKSIIITPTVDSVSTYYTLDGSNPNNTKTLYLGAISIDGNNGDTIVLNCASYDSVGNLGLINTQSYTFDKMGPIAPISNVATGSYITAQTITLTLALDSVNTYYTLDGSNPDSTKIAYIGPINIDGANGVVKVFRGVSYDDVGNIGDTSLYSYTFDKVGPSEPIANIISGIFYASQNVTLSLPVDGESIYYTTDGSEPDNTKSLYCGAINIDGNDGVTVLLKSVSYDNSGNVGSMLEISLTFDKAGPNEVLTNVSSGTYNNVQNISITPAEDAINTYYTLDGIDPDNTKIPYTSEITIDGNDGETIVLKVVSYDLGGNIGDIVTLNYIFDKQGPQSPVPDVDEGTYNTSKDIVLTPAIDAVSTYYTLDGNNADDTCILYDGVINIDGSDGDTVILKAVSYDSLGNIGFMMTKNYLFDKPGTLAPIASVNSGTFNIIQNVILNVPVDAALTYYTLDGSEPDNTKTLYVGNINIDDINGNTVVLKAVCYDVNNIIGDKVTYSYIFDKLGPDSPVASVLGGSYNSSQSVELTVAGDSVNTYYTLDGSNPDNTKTIYDIPIVIDGSNGETIILKTVSYDIYGNIGSVLTNEYTFSKVTSSSSSNTIIDEEEIPEDEIIKEDEENITILINDNDINNKLFFDISNEVLGNAIEGLKNIIIENKNNKIILSFDFISEIFPPNNNNELEAEMLKSDVLLSGNIEQLKQHGNLFEYKLNIISKDNAGNETKNSINSFENSIQIEVDYSDISKAIKNNNKLGIYELDESGNWKYIRSHIDTENNRIIFETNSLNEYGIMEYEKSFIDVKSSHWANEYVDILLGKHITEGVDQNHFAPEEAVTRAQFAAFIVKTLDIELETNHRGIFKDVESNSWYELYVESAAKAGLIEGVGDNNFAPNKEITREEMTVMIMRAYSHISDINIGEEAKRSTAKFDDVDKVSNWALDYMLAAQANGIISGMTDTTLEPRGTASRAQAAKLLVKLLNKDESLKYIY